MSTSEMLPTRSGRVQFVEIPLAIGFAGLCALSPVTSSGRIAISVVVGTIFGIGLYGYRWWARLPASETSLPNADHDAGGHSLLPLLVTAGLVLALFLPALIKLYPWYTESVWRNAHGLFLPLLIFAVSRHAIRHLEDRRIAGSIWGVAVLIPGLLLAVFDSRVGSLHFTVAGMPLVAGGSIVLLMGWNWARALAVPLAMLLFFSPIPSGISVLLGFGPATAASADWILSLFGYSFLRNGMIFIVSETLDYGISQRCAGFSIFYGALALSVALAAVVGSWRRFLLMVGVALPLTLAINGARIAALIVYCEARGVGPSQTLIHGVSGIAAYLAITGIVLLLAGRTARLRLLAQ